MTNTTLTPIKRDAVAALTTVINGPHGNAVILGCTICVLAGIVGVCFLASEGYLAVFSVGDSKLQVMCRGDEVL